MPQNYVSLSGPIYAGKFAPASMPTWVANITDSTWGIIPSSNTLNDLNPQLDPLLNPRYSENPQDPPRPEFMGNHTSIIRTWCGGCYDPVTKKYFLPLNGGHADYAGNEPYAQHLNNETTYWEMIRPPTGAIGNEVVTNDGQEGTGLYSDGRLRAIHSYNKHVFVQGVGIVLAVIGNTSWSGQAGSGQGAVIDPITGELTEMLPQHPQSGGGSGGGATHDTLRNRIWWRGRASSPMSSINMDGGSKVWSQHGGTESGGGDTSLTYLPDHDCILIFKAFDNSPSGVTIFDCVTHTYHPITVSGSLIGGVVFTGTAQPVVIGPNKVAFWNNTSSTEVIQTLEFTGDPRTATWTIGQLPVAPENSVIPTARALNSTWNRLVYDDEWKLIMVVNATNEPTYAYKLAV